jgi:hypothetical protein
MDPNRIITNTFCIPANNRKEAFPSNHFGNVYPNVMLSILKKKLSTYKSDKTTFDVVVKSVSKTDVGMF